MNAPMDTWLRDHLVRSGHLTETGISRRARLTPCPGSVGGRRCPDLVLAGLDDDWAALEARTDPLPLSPLGEALAAVEDRATYALSRTGAGWMLDRRDHHKITYAPAGSRSRRDVVRQHRCGTPPPSGPLTAPSSFPETRPPTPAGGPPPF